MKHEDRVKIVKNANLISQALCVAAKQYEADAEVARNESDLVAAQTGGGEAWGRISQQFLKQAQDCRDLAAMFADMQE